MFVEFQGCFSGFSGVTKSAEIDGVLVPPAPHHFVIGLKTVSYKRNLYVADYFLYVIMYLHTIMYLILVLGNAKNWKHEKKKSI